MSNKKEKLRKLLLASSAIAVLGSAASALAVTPTRTANKTGADTSDPTHWSQINGNNAAIANPSILKAFNNGNNDAATMSLNQNGWVYSIDLNGAETTLEVKESAVLGKFENSNQASQNKKGTIKFIAGGKTITLTGDAADHALLTVVDFNNVGAAKVGGKLVIGLGDTAIIYSGTFVNADASNSIVETNSQVTYTGASDLTNIVLNVTGKSFILERNAAGDRNIGNVTISDAATFRIDSANAGADYNVKLAKNASIVPVTASKGELNIDATTKTVTLAAADSNDPGTSSIGTNDKTIGILDITIGGANANKAVLNLPVYANTVSTHMSNTNAAGAIVEFNKAATIKGALDLSGDTTAATYTFAENSTIEKIIFPKTLPDNTDSKITIADGKDVTIKNVEVNNNKHQGIIEIGEGSTLSGGATTKGKINKIELVASDKVATINGGNHTGIKFIGDGTILKLTGDGVTISGKREAQGAAHTAAVTIVANGKNKIEFASKGNIIGDIGATTLRLGQIKVDDSIEATLKPQNAIHVNDIYIGNNKSKLIIDGSEFAGANKIEVNDDNVGGTIDFDGGNGILSFAGSKTIVVDHTINTLNQKAEKGTIEVSMDDDGMVGFAKHVGHDAGFMGAINILKGQIAVRGSSSIKTVTVNEDGALVITTPEDDDKGSLNVTVKPSVDGKGAVIASGNVTFGTNAKIGDESAYLEAVLLRATQDNEATTLSIEEKAPIYANAIAVSESNKHTLKLLKGDYSFKSIGVKSSNRFTTGAEKLKELIFADGVQNVDVGNANISTVKLANNSTIELKGTAYAIADIVNNNTADIQSTVAFNNSEALTFSGNIGSTQAGSSAVALMVLKGKDVTLAHDREISVKKTRFEEDVVLTLDKKPGTTTTFSLGTIEAAKNNIGTVDIKNMTFSLLSPQDANMHIKEFRGNEGSTIKVASDVYSALTVAKSGISNLIIEGTGKIGGAIGSATAKYATVTIGDTLDRSIENNIYADSLKVDGKATIAPQGTTSITVDAPITFTKDAGTLIVQHNTAIAKDISAGTDGFGKIEFYGAGTDTPLARIGTQSHRMNSVSFGKADADTAGKGRTLSSNIYANEITVNEASLNISKDLVLDSSNITIQGATLGLKSNHLTLKSNNPITLAGVLTVDYNIQSAKKEPIILEGKVDYKALNKVITKHNGIVEILPVNGRGQVFNYNSSKISAEDKLAINKLIGVPESASKYIKLKVEDNGDITADVDFTPYSQNMTKFTSKLPVAEQRRLNIMTTEFSKTPADVNSDAAKMYVAVNNSEVTKEGSSLDIVNSLAPQGTDMDLALFATDTATAAINGATAVLNAPAVPSGDEDTIGYNFIAQGFYGQAWRDNANTHSARGYNAGIQGGLVGVEYNDGVISGGVAGVYTTSTLTYAEKLALGIPSTTTTDTKATTSSTVTSVDTDPVTGNSYGAVAVLTYSLPTGLYVDGVLGVMQSNIKDNTVRLNDLSNSQKVTSDTNILTINGQVIGGYNLNVSDGVSITPMIGLKTAYLSQDPYKEEAAGPAKLDVKGGSGMFYSALAGAKVSGNMITEDSMNISGDIHGIAEMAIGNTQAEKVVSLSGGQDITVPILTNDSSAMIYNVGARASVGKGQFNATLGIDARFGNASSKSVTGYVRVEVNVY